MHNRSFQLAVFFFILEIFLYFPRRMRQSGGKKEANSCLKKTDLISLLIAILWLFVMHRQVTESYLLSCFVIAHWPT